MTTTTPTGAAGELAAPVTGTELRHLMRRWPTGAAVVTSRSAAGPIGCTVTAFTSVSLDPPLLLVSLARDSRTLAGVLAHGRFGVNLLTWRQRLLAAQFAAASGDRFSGVAHRLEHDVPVLDGSAAAVVCAVERAVPVADHVLLLGSPQWYEKDEATEPLVCLDSQYATANPDGRAQPVR